mgnify:CR=1 FL=1
MKKFLLVVIALFVGTAAAQSQLRSVLGAIDVQLMVQPEIYLNYRDGLIVDGEFTDENFKALLRGWTDKFSEWIVRLKRPVLTF